MTSALSQQTAATARQQMVDQQVRTWDVLNPTVLGVLGDVRRENFVPRAYRNVAFADSNVPLGHGQVMLAPKLDGKILQALNLARTDEVLDVGSGSGFLAACFGRLAAHVRSVEIFPDLVEQAKANLHNAAANNVTVETLDATTLTEEDRYDAIAISAALPVYDTRWAKALRVGGRLFAVVGKQPVMEAIKITRLSATEWQRESLFETVIPELINAQQPPRFVF